MGSRTGAKHEWKVAFGAWIWGEFFCGQKEGESGSEEVILGQLLEGLMNARHGQTKGRHTYNSLEIALGIISLARWNTIQARTALIHAGAFLRRVLVRSELCNNMFQ